MEITPSVILPCRDRWCRQRLHRGATTFLAAFVSVTALAPITSSAGPSITAVGFDGTIVRSDDGGANWNQQSSNITRELRTVDFVDPNTGWTGGMFEATSSTNTATMRFTTNGGSSWQSADFQTSPNGLLINDVDFVDANTGWFVAGGGNIWRSGNGGLNWSPQNSGEIDDFQAVDFVNETHGTDALPES